MHRGRDKWQEMTVSILMMLVGLAIGKYTNGTAENQLPIFKHEHVLPIGILTTSAGAPIELREATDSVNSELISNEYFMESITQLSRERIPERVVHAKGTGAFGYFEVTHDISDICKAKLFSKIGKKTPIAVRFSNVFEDRGGIDTPREVRGFALKFYTEEGNFDYVGLDVEMFVIKDPLLFPTFGHVFKRNPATNLHDRNSRWDFLTLRPETLNMFMLIFGDRGIPANYSNIPSFAIHTYQLENESGETTFVRMHILPDAGIKTITSKEAKEIAGEDSDYLTRSLYNQIANGDYPTYTFSVQTATPEEALNASFDLFDVTLKWPLEEFPLRPIGKIVLNRNPENQFAQVEQAAYCPSNLVPGIIGGVDRLFEARRLSYKDAQLYRLGKNYNKIEVNCPFQTVAKTYNRDGIPYLGNNYGDIPNYFPNSFNGPIPYIDVNRNKLYRPYTDPNPTNLEQAAYQYLFEMAEDEKGRLVDNIVTDLLQAAEFLQKKAIDLYTLIYPELGSRIADGLQTCKALPVDAENYLTCNKSIRV